MNICQKIGDHESEAVILADVGSVIERSGDFNEALKYYESSLEISQEINNRELQAGILESMGTNKLNSGNLMKH